MTDTKNINEILTGLLEIAIDLGRYQKSDQENVAQALQHYDSVGGLAAAGTGLAAVARRLLKEADARQHFFPDYVPADPVWPILLDLYIHAAETRKVTVSDACLASRVPNTTALRWIKELVELGLVERSPDAVDRRRKYLKISAEAFVGMSRYLASISGIDALIAAAGVGDTIGVHKQQQA
jgi:hypothetical protein